MSLLLIDNYDSFTFNLAQYLGELGHAPVVRRNDEITLGDVEAMHPNRIVISPGPGRPEDAGITVEVIRRLGHGADLRGLPRAPGDRLCLRRRGDSRALADARQDVIDPADGQGVFNGHPAVRAGRYHSLIVADPPPETLAVTARTDGGVIMGLRHRSWPVHGVQFHPRVGPHRRGTQDSAQFSGAGMFTGLIDKLQRRVDLTVDEAADAMETIMDGRAQPSQMAGFLIGLAMKGERPAEIVGLARTMRARAVKLSRSFDPVFDTCGTGGDGAHTFNVSTVAALVLAASAYGWPNMATGAPRAAAAAPICSRPSASRSPASPATVERCLDQAGIAFLFAQTFHPSMKHVAQTRRELGVRTAFNLLGPLTNPAGATRQLVGVARPELTELVARSLAQLGAVRAWVVHGADGLDEISTTGYTKVSECRDGAVNTFYLHPADVGLGKASPLALKGGDAADNARIARAVLDGEPGPARDIVLLNAGASLLIAGRVATIPDGIAMAREAIDSGRAAAVLDTLVKTSRMERSVS